MSRYRKLRPIYESARIEAGTLARFAEGLTWRQIQGLDPTIAMGWWRGAVFNAEAAGLLWWDKANKAWWLSDDGKQAVRDVA